MTARSRRNWRGLAGSTTTAVKHGPSTTSTDVSRTNRFHASGDRRIRRRVPDAEDDQRRDAGDAGAGEEVDGGGDDPSRTQCGDLHRSRKRRFVMKERPPRGRLRLWRRGGPALGNASSRRVRIQAAARRGQIPRHDRRPVGGLAAAPAFDRAGAVDGGIQHGARDHRPQRQHVRAGGQLRQVDRVADDRDQAVDVGVARGHDFCPLDGQMFCRLVPRSGTCALLTASATALRHDDAARTISETFARTV